MDTESKLIDLKNLGRIILGNYIICTYQDLNYVGLNIMQIDGKSFIKLSYYTEKPNIGHLSCLCVPKECRRQGRGRSTMAFAEMIAKKMGMTELNGVLENMDWRHDWYNRLGFEDNFHDSTLVITKKI